jgi:GLPGLI family protein
MKKILVIALTIISAVGWAQINNGEVHYLSQRKLDLGEHTEQIPQAFRAQIMEQLKASGQKKYVLKIKGSESNYSLKKEKEGLNTQANENIQIQVIGSSSGGDNLYKNTKKMEYLMESEIMGKRFLIADKLPAIAWKMINETKVIGKYKAQKAIHVETTEENGKTINDTVTVWFTTQIPISNGPKKLFGLPGLILEYEDKFEKIICTNVKLDGKLVEITIPKKGKKVSEKEFNAIMEKKEKEIRERYNLDGNENGSFHMEIISD